MINKSRQQYACYSATRLDHIWSDIKFVYYKVYYYKKFEVVIESVNTLNIRTLC